MQSKKILLLWVFSIWFCGMTLCGYLSPSISAIQSPKIAANLVGITAEKDTYIDSYNPTSNYGGQDYIYVGQSAGYQTTFFYFNFSQKPASFQSVYLKLDPGIFRETTNISVNLFDPSQTWNEYTMTYSNKITICWYSLDFILKIEDACLLNITEFFNRYSLSGLSISINSSYYYESYFSIYSRECAMKYSWATPLSLYFVQSGDSLILANNYYKGASNEIVASADTHIYSDEYYSNYGGLDTCYLGQFLSDFYTTIIRFENIPTSLKNLTLKFYLYGIDETQNVYVTIKTAAQQQSWNEYTLTYANWPYEAAINFCTLENVNYSIMVVNSGVVYIDLDSWIGNSSLDVILSLPLETDDYVYCYSREGGSSYSKPPLLQITTTSSGSTDTEDSSNNDTDTPSSNGFWTLLAIIGIGLGTAFLIQMQNKHQTLQSSRKPSQNYPPDRVLQSRMSYETPQDTVKQMKYWRLFNF